MNIIINDKLEGKGYVGDMYSVNALLSLENNEKPISKWNKAEIVQIAKKVNPDLDVRLLNKINLKILKSKFLQYVGVHHMGANFENVSFFAIDLDSIKKLNNEDLKKFIDLSKSVTKEQKRTVKLAEDIEKERIKRKLKDREKRAELEKLLKYSKYRDLQHLIVAVNDGKIDIEDLKLIQKKCINIKRTELKDKWIRERRFEDLEKLNDDDFIDSLCKGMVK